MGFPPRLAQKLVVVRGDLGRKQSHNHDLVCSQKLTHDQSSHRMKSQCHLDGVLDGIAGAVEALLQDLSQALVTISTHGHL
jgi:hypothetical protein